VGLVSSWLLDGWGVRAIVVGEKDKGKVDSRHVKYEERWRERWAPGLVRTRFVNVLSDSVVCF